MASEYAKVALEDDDDTPIIEIQVEGPPADAETELIVGVVNASIDGQITSSFDNKYPPFFVDEEDVGIVSNWESVSTAYRSRSPASLSSSLPSPATNTPDSGFLGHEFDSIPTASSWSDVDSSPQLITSFEEHIRLRELSISTLQISYPDFEFSVSPESSPLCPLFDDQELTWLTSAGAVDHRLPPLEHSPPPSYRLLPPPSPLSGFLSDPTPSTVKSTRKKAKRQRSLLLSPELTYLADGQTSTRRSRHRTKTMKPRRSSPYPSPHASPSAREATFPARASSTTTYAPPMQGRRTIDRDMSASSSNYAHPSTSTPSLHQHSLSTSAHEHRRSADLSSLELRPDSPSFAKRTLANIRRRSRSISPFEAPPSSSDPHHPRRSSSRPRRDRDVFSEQVPTFLTQPPTAPSSPMNASSGAHQLAASTSYSPTQSNFRLRTANFDTPAQPLVYATKHSGGARSSRPSSLVRSSYTYRDSSIRTAMEEHSISDSDESMDNRTASNTGMYGRRKRSISSASSASSSSRSSAPPPPPPPSSASAPPLGGWRKSREGEFDNEDGMALDPRQSELESETEGKGKGKARAVRDVRRSSYPYSSGPRSLYPPQSQAYSTVPPSSSYHPEEARARTRARTRSRSWERSRSASGERYNQYKNTTTPSSVGSGSQFRIIAPSSSTQHRRHSSQYGGTSRLANESDDRHRHSPSAYPRPAHALSMSTSLPSIGRKAHSLPSSSPQLSHSIALINSTSTEHNRNRGGAEHFRGLSEDHGRDTGLEAEPRQAVKLKWTAKIPTDVPPPRPAAAPSHKPSQAPHPEAHTDWGRIGGGDRGLAPSLRRHNNGEVPQSHHYRRPQPDSEEDDYEEEDYEDDDGDFDDDDADGYDAYGRPGLHMFPSMAARRPGYRASSDSPGGSVASSEYYPGHHNHMGPPPRQSGPGRPPIVDRVGGVNALSSLSLSHLPPPDADAATIASLGGLVVPGVGVMSERAQYRSVGSRNIDLASEKRRKGVKKFQCRFGDCNKMFTTNQNRQIHQWKHTGEKPYRCHCGYGSASRSDLRRHLHRKSMNSKCEELPVDQEYLNALATED